MNQIHLIPVLTTLAGSCLTTENWLELGVDCVTYDLMSLLMKPGFEQLISLPDMASYTTWPNKIILNAIMPVDKGQGYLLRSQYDGSRRHYTHDDILTLITQLNPFAVLMPTGLNQEWQALPETILPFFSLADLPKNTERLHGVYFIYNNNMPFSHFLQQIQPHVERPLYVSGELSFSQMQQLTALGVQYIASDKPAQDASDGIVYSQEGSLLLNDALYRLDFNVIDELCHCPTCEAKLTRAYLHHLFEHTPLLCQRFLIQHNVGFMMRKGYDVTQITLGE